MFGHNRTLTQRLLALGPEALWMPGNGETLVSGRVSSAPDLTGHGHTLAQATDAKRPLYVAGPPPYWEFDGARVLGGSPIALPSSYSIFAVANCTTPPASAQHAFVLADGVYGADGATVSIYNNAGPIVMIGSQSTPFAYWLSPSGVTGLVHTDSLWTGTEGKVRWNAGSWGTPAAATVITTPTTGLFVGAQNGTPTSEFIGRIYGVGLRSPRFSDAELAQLSATINAGWGIP